MTENNGPAIPLLSQRYPLFLLFLCNFRGGMVDKDHQYIFVYRALYEYWTNKRQTSAVTPSFERGYSHVLSSASSQSGDTSPALSNADVKENNNDSIEGDNAFQKFQGFALFTE